MISGRGFPPCARNSPPAAITTSIEVLALQPMELGAYAAQPIDGVRLGETVKVLDFLRQQTFATGEHRVPQGFLGSHIFDDLRHFNSPSASGAGRVSTAA